MKDAAKWLGSDVIHTHSAPPVSDILSRLTPVILTHIPTMDPDSCSF